MKHFLELMPYFFMGGWAVFSAYYIYWANRFPEKMNVYVLESIPQIFATIGILGTFMGIAYGLHSFNVRKIEDSIPELLDGLRTAFYASIAGIILLIISSKFVEFTQKKYDRMVPTPETVALNRVADLLAEMKMDVAQNFEYTQQINQKLDAVSNLGDLGAEIADLNRALKALSTDLAKTIEAGFENVLIQQEKHNTVPLLQALQQQVDELSNRIDSSTAEITQKVVNELAVRIEVIVEEFKKSMSETAKTELENIIAYLRQTGRALSDFPARFQAMSENLTKNFGHLQEMLQKTTLEALSQTNESTSVMRKQIQEMNDIVKYFYTIYS
jgi:MotA/TolQ/ExbB proton channel family